MTDPTAEFFENWGRRGYEPLFARVTGTVRLDLRRDERIDHWFIEVDKGNIRLSRDADRPAECVIHADGSVFDRVITGDAHALSAWLRNEITVEGALRMLRLLEKILPDPRFPPSPPGALEPRPLTPADEEAAVRNEKFVRILDGNVFVVSDARGDVEALPNYATGFFTFDTRFLSTWRLLLNGKRLRPLSVDNLQYFEARFFLSPGIPAHNADAKLSIIRHRWISSSFDEELTIFNHDSEPADITLRIEAASDFAGLIEINNVRKKKGRHYASVRDGTLCLGYERELFRRETVISSTTPAQVDEHGFTFDFRIEPQGSWGTRLHVETLGRQGRELRTILQGEAGRGRPEKRQELDEWIGRAPRLLCDNEALGMTYQRSLVDLAALRYRPLATKGRAIPSGGLPWSMTIVGRDALLACLEVLPFVPELVPTTLRILGLVQGTQIDDFRDEQPGKIFQEGRYWEMAAFEEHPSSAYYGSADVTPLYVVLLDEYERWSGDADLVHELEPEVRAGIEWIDRYGDLMGNGYLAYQSRNPYTGVVNQGWKDSWDAISYRDGRLPGLPRATCELQGYVYDAKIRAARMAREIWGDPAYADRLEREAAELRERFNRDFWVEDGEYYALALDADGRQVDALASNMGHLLWSGIVDRPRAEAIVKHLFGPRMFSGWGVRTLATGEGRYNPIGYHVGTVWPFDNAFIAWGLRRYGFIEESARIAEAMIDAAEFFQGRLPEAFGGYDRELTKYPVLYPTASSPYGRSTGTPLLLLRTMLGLDSQGGYLVVDPAVPDRIGRVKLLDIPGRWGRADAFGRPISDTRARRVRRR